jgi:hypothetical protein
VALKTVRIVYQAIRAKSIFFNATFLNSVKERASHGALRSEQFAINPLS